MKQKKTYTPSKKSLSEMTFTEQVEFLCFLVHGDNDLLHAELVFKTILNNIKAVGYAYIYQRDLVLKTLKSCLKSFQERYGIDSTHFREFSRLYSNLEYLYVKKD